MSRLSQILNEIKSLNKEAQILDLQITVTGYRLLNLIKGETK
jgi:hypothetical protein